jgi:NAD-dependent deacetylase
MKKIVVLTGAGISAESGISTFRDSDGLWENYDVRDVASPEGWAKNPELVLEFYNQRRRGVMKAEPNAAHKAIAKLDKHYQVQIITQNIDDLHERGGSKNIMHIHGELLKVRSVTVPTEIMHWTDDIKLGDTCKFGGQLRPHIVWFGEEVTLINKANREMRNADYVIVVGSSMQVYPAAGLVSEAPRNTKIWFVDPRPSLNFELKNSKNLTVVEENATIGVPLVVDLLIKMAEEDVKLK